ncbi:MAG: ATP-binding cassette domain-containing protein [Phycisphaerae bacterium]|nr:ATP-binding cassette domain-containing protein [Phycisphaerae bacterium]
MAQNQPPLLEFRNVTVIKGRKKILNCLSLTIRTGENVALLGPNGAGKSSFIKAITREYYPLPQKTGFSFRIWGKDRWDVFDLRFLLGIVSSDLQGVFAYEISGMDVVLSGFFSSIGLYGHRITRQMRKKAEEILRFLEIYQLRNRFMTEMSSGEARRFLIARALIHNPKTLILDEPTNSLDLHAQHIFRKVLRKISKSGIGIVLITQNMQDIIPEISRVILMRNGRFYKDGPKTDVLTSSNISRLFKVPVRIKKEKGYYYVIGF